MEEAVGQQQQQQKGQRNRGNTMFGMCAGSVSTLAKGQAHAQHAAAPAALHAATHAAMRTQ
eukprot:121876-Pelagomonas_calceolata.AAC.1